MSKKYSDPEMLFKERENIFDDYYNLIERTKLRRIGHVQSGELVADYETVIKALTILERTIEDLAADKKLPTNYFNILNEYIIECLKQWLPIFEELVYQPKFIDYFSYNTIALALLVHASKELSIIDLRRDIIFLSPSRQDRVAAMENQRMVQENKEKELLALNEEMIALVRGSFKDILAKPISKKEILVELKKLEADIKQFAQVIPRHPFHVAITPSRHFPHFQTENILLLANRLKENYEIGFFKAVDFIGMKTMDKIEIESYRSKINHNARTIHEAIEGYRTDDRFSFEWSIEVTISDEKYDAESISFLMWAIASALNSIDGVTTELEDWGKGSRKFSLRVIIRDWLAKEEVKQVLDKGRKAAEAQYLDKPINEAERTKAETGKIVKETEALLSADQQKQLHDLEIEKKELDLDEKKIEIMNKATDGMIKRFEALRQISTLIKEGIIKNDSDIQIIVNDLLFFQKVGGKIRSGEPISIIEEKESKLLNPSKAEKGATEAGDNPK
jgi:hypothetical protein